MLKARGPPSSEEMMSISHQRRGLLPYGDTLHYQGCGCPDTWTHGARAADIVDYVSQVNVHQQILEIAGLVQPKRSADDREVHLSSLSNCPGAIIRISFGCCIRNHT